MNMNPVAVPINELSTRRWSPYGFDPSREVGREDLDGLFEAARWSMSAFNAQPWRYIVGVRGRSQQAWDSVLASLLEGNRGWAQHAPVLALGLVEQNFEHNGKPNPAALHDLGAASASLSYEAVARGLAVHQMAGIDPDKARELFDLPETVRPFSGLAIGFPAPSPAQGQFGKRDQRPRERRPLKESILHGGW